LRPLFLFVDLHGALFHDAGRVARDSFSVGQIGHGIGIGLRYLLPFGPARLDFAHNPGPSFAAKRDWAIHFGFGFTFLFL
jgi:outer membrane translocation and assembly module TamA